MELGIEKLILGHNFALVFDDLYEKRAILEVPFEGAFTRILEVANLTSTAFKPDKLVAQLIRETRFDNDSIQTVRKLRVDVLSEGVPQNVIDYIQFDNNAGVRVREAEEICGFVNYIAKENVDETLEIMNF